MRKILMVIVIALLLSCQKEETPENVTFEVSYILDKGVEMTRGGEDLYLDFYNNFIKTKKVGYPKYELTFYKGEQVVGTFSGEWEASLITLPEGTYRVEGTSKSRATGVEQSGANDQYSTLSLNFSEQVTISKNQASLTLNPTYDCYLLFFDASLFNRGLIWGPNSYDSKTYCRFFDADTIKYAFINSASRATEIGYVTKDGDEGAVTISTMGFEIGKYYCLDVLATGYQLPPMENGF